MSYYFAWFEYFVAWSAIYMFMCPVWTLFMQYLQDRQESEVQSIL